MATAILVTKVKPKLATTPTTAYNTVPAAHQFKVTTSGDFEQDIFLVAGANSTEATQNATNEHYRRNGILPASIDTIVQTK